MIEHVIRFDNSRFGKFCKQHIVAVTTAGEIVAEVTTIILACRGTTKLEQLKQEGKVGNTPKEVVKTYTKVYWPTAVSGLCSACMVGYTNNKFAKRLEAASAALTISNAALSRVQNSMKKVLPPKEIREVNEEKANDILKNHPLDEANIINTGNGSTLFFNSWNGQYFLSSVQAVNNAFQKIDILERKRKYGFISGNEIEEALNIPLTKNGEYLGIAIDDPNDYDNYDAKECLIEFDISNVFRTKFEEHPVAIELDYMLSDINGML